MRFLVTRPDPDCALTADKLRARGHHVDEAPLLLFQQLAPEKFDLKNIAAVAVTSRRAVQVLKGHPQCAELSRYPAYAVGDATASALRAAGFANVKSASGNVTALSGLVSDHRAQLGSGRVLYPAAKDRAGDLEALLGRAGVPCSTVTVYGMVPVNELPSHIVEALSVGRYDGVLIYSRRTAETFVALLKAYKLHHIFSSLRIYAISEQAAAPLEGLACVYLSEAAREEALLGLALGEC